jgi:hypothetical protein
MPGQLCYTQPGTYTPAGPEVAAAECSGGGGWHVHALHTQWVLPAAPQRELVYRVGSNQLAKTPKGWVQGSRGWFVDRSCI